MNAPTVCAVMLANGRDAMVARAVASFRAQTYPECHLLIWNTGTPDQFFEHALGSASITVAYSPERGTIGALRNAANAIVSADIIAHWDSDDWSEPRRIEKQVALLQSSGVDCVGYRDMLFWREPPGEAWLYTGHLLGSSMCYRRAAWQRIPFEDKSHGEDYLWWKQQRCAAVSSLADSDPRMICSIHPGNTSPDYAKIAQKSEWQRAPQWDGTAARVMMYT